MEAPELLAKYPFFAGLNDAQLRAVALITTDQLYEYGDTLFEEGEPADKLFLVVQGSVDLYFRVNERPKHRVLMGEVDPGMPLGISALIAPHTYGMTARAGARSKVLVMDGSVLRALFELDPAMGYAFMLEIAKASQERLHLARLQLARELEPDPVI